MITSYSSHRTEVMKTEQNKPAKEKLEHLDKLVQKGREFGMVYKFDAIGILMSQVKMFKLEGSNGKAKGIRMAAGLLSNLKPVQGAAVVTHCVDCMKYDKKTHFCSHFGLTFHEDDFCSKASPVPKTSAAPTAP